MKIAYFARPITHYGTHQDNINILCIELAGFEVEDITTDVMQERYKTEGMEMFRPIIESCDALFFLAFDDGKIGAGVAREIEWAGENSIPVFELPINITSRMLSVSDTRRRVHERLRSRDE